MWAGVDCSMVHLLSLFCVEFPHVISSRSRHNNIKRSTFSHDACFNVHPIFIIIIFDKIFSVTLLRQSVPNNVLYLCIT